ncbi:MAG: class I SAM-dependent methyltransferase [Anaerolineales bacterium]|nr:class I SAM-dependent methyltransferase [Anaerolineales bacterium]
MADQGSEGLLSPFLRERRIQAARPYLMGRVLDVGCGTGLLARYVPTENYLGIDIDQASLAQAQAAFPQHRFLLTDTAPEDGFNTIVALAVIEHVPDPTAFLASLREQLAHQDDSRIVCTTPHPTMESVHRIGASIGIFSKSANEEHQALLDRQTLTRTGEAAGLVVCHYRRFLLGANQVVVYALKGRC